MQAVSWEFHIGGGTSRGPPGSVLCAEVWHSWLICSPGYKGAPSVRSDGDSFASCVHTVSHMSKQTWTAE